MRFSDSIRFRLVAMMVVIITALLLVLGLVNYFLTKNNLEAQLDRSIQSVSKRLERNLPASLWNFDQDAISGVIASELSSPEVAAILVWSESKFITGQRREPDGKLVTLTDGKPPADRKVKEVPLSYDNSGKLTAVGKAHIVIADDSIKAALNTGVVTKLIEIIILDLVIIFAIQGVLYVMVIRPLTEVRDALKQIAAGDADLTSRLRESRRDELGEVAHWFNTFVERIHGVVSKAIDGTRNISEAAAATTRIASDTINGVQLQKDEIDAVAGSIQQLVARVQSVTNDSNHASEFTHRASGDAQRGRQVVLDAVAAISDMSHDVKRASDVIQSLAEESRRVGSVLESINDIAKQTNLLALNAAIEAARAGEQGRGFAVVADEVRELSSRTHAATTEIQQVVAGITAGTAQAVDVMSHSTKRAEILREQAATAGQTIGGITDSIGQITALSEQIADAAKMQSEAVDTIASSITKITRVADQTAAGAEATARAEEQLTAAAGKLQALMQQFRV